MLSVALGRVNAGSLGKIGKVAHAATARLGHRVLVWGGLLAAGALGLQFVPLFDVLGYDYAFALGLAAAVAAVDLGHGAASAARRAGRDPGDLTVAWIAVLGALSVLALPLLLSLANALRIRNCNITGGLVFFALLPLATSVFAAPAGVLAGVWAPHRGRLIAWLLPIGSVVWSLLRLYVDPPVFVYDPFGGYFPGPIYDEALSPPPRLGWFRLVNLVWIASAWLVHLAFRGWRARPSGNRPWMRSGFAALGLFTSITLFAARGHLGFHVTHGRLEQVLSRAILTPHFVLHVAPGAHTEPDLALMQRDLEFRHEQLARVLGVQPAGPVHVYQFANTDLKKELVGAAYTLYAKPWTREIFIQVDRFPARRLRHELAHVFAGAFGDPLFGVSLAVNWWGPLPVPRLASGLIEGAAEAADFGDPDGRTTVHQEAQAMIKAGLAPPLAQVVGAGFTTLAGARAYTIAGSFSHFLLSTYGAERFRAAYRSAGDFAGVYGESFAALEQKWRAFLAQQQLDAREQARAKERFRRGAIFQKVCARELAARVERAREILYADPPVAVTLFESVCRDDPREPTYDLDLAEALTAAGRLDEALRLTARIETDERLTDPLRARAATQTASLHVLAGRVPEAKLALERALRLAGDEGERRTLQAKQRALADDEARRTIGRVLFGDGPGRGLEAGLLVHLVGAFARSVPDEALGAYLLGRQLLHRDAKVALPLLEVACPLAGGPTKAIPLSPLFLRECHRMVADAAFRDGDLARARVAWQRLREDGETEAERLRASDFLERIAWEERRRPTGP